MAVEALQLALHRAADAAAVSAVQPGAHHAQAVVPLLPVEREVLHLGGDALAAPGRRDRGAAVLLPGGGRPSARCPPPHAPQDGARDGLPRCAASPHPEEGCPELTEGSASHRGRPGRPSAGSPGSSWPRVGETQTRRRAWSSFLPGVGWSGGHRKRQCEQSLSILLPAPQFKDRTKLDRLSGREMEGTCLSALTVAFPAGTLPCRVPSRKTGAQEFHEVPRPSPPVGLWIPQGLLAEHDQGWVSSPNSQATPYPVPEAHTPCLPY